jgi:tetratricopeptide (TPR) repeat protein
MWGPSSPSLCGSAAAIEWVGKKLKEERPARSVSLAAAALLLILSPGMLLARNYSLNDRSGNYVAWDYSYNMLMSCAKNGILFTNGDNDTFPVWYLQEVDSVRRDVRIVNLSLLNTGWYIKQLKDREPKVPISFSDTYVDRYLDQHDAAAMMTRYWPPEKQKVEMNTPEGKMSWTVPAAMYIPIRESESRQNNFLRVQDVMILDIMRTNWDATKTPVPKPVYFAVTVASSNMVGLRDYLTFDGLVFRVNPKGRQPVDAEALRRSLFETFKGHFRGINNPHVHFDDNVEKLLQNYRSGFLQLAYYYSMLPDTNPSAGSQYESLSDREAHFDQLSNRQKGLTVMMKLDELIPESVRPISNPELTLQIAKMYYDMGRPDEMMQRLEILTARSDLRLETRARIAGFWAAYAKNEQRAKEIITDALGLTPTAEQCYSAGRELFGAGDYSLAAQCFENALALNPNDGQAIGALMQAYEYAGQRSKSIAVLQDWVSRHPSDRGAKQRLDQMIAADTGAGRPAN